MMLVGFQKETIQYLDKLAGDFRVRLDGMAERVAAIENIISGQEKYATGDRAMDDIDLEVLVKEALAMVRLSSSNTLDIEIDISIGQVGSLKGPRNALMYIFTNLINNAAEAITRAERKNGQIKIAAEIEESDELKFVHVMIIDNGIGILKENLQKIFERGFTTKGGETSGIGLHWCANTIASLQGRLYAESKGIDKGATFHLHIPQIQTESDIVT